MNAQEFLKKYGLWIAGFALVGYLAYRNLRGGSARPLIGPAPPGAAGFSADQYRLESERLRQSGTLDIERLRIDAAIEAARRKADNDRFNLEQQIAAQRRAQGAAQRGQTLGLIGQAINALASLFKGQQSQKGGSSGGGIGTPPTFPGGGRTQPQNAPFYLPPAPDINVLYDPSYQPSFPAAPEYLPLRIDDWGEPPAFQTSGLDFDGGATFFGQSVYGMDGGDFNYGYGYDQGYSESPGFFDYVGGEFYYPEAGSDFIYGFGQGGSDPSGGGGYYYDAGDDFIYGYGEGQYEEGA